MCSNEKNLHGMYGSLDVAKVACAKDFHCIGVQDTGCKNIMSFQLCKNGFMKPGRGSSCVHEKKLAPGMYLLISVLSIILKIDV